MESIEPLGEVRNGEGATSPPTARVRGKFAAYYALGLLTLIGAFNYIDKQVLGLVMPLVKADLRLTDTQLGLLTGVAFVVFNALLSVPIAQIADRWSRRKVIAIGLAFWSVMTAATGFVGNVWQLAVTRFLTGAGEAAGTAPSNALVSDLFGVASRPLAISVLTAGAPLGLMLFSPLAGLIADTYGWRAVFIVAGAPGIILALLLLTTVREPARPQPAAGVAPDPIGVVIAYMFRARSYVLVLAGLACIGGSVSAGVWNVTFLQRVHGLTLSEIGFVIGPVRGGMGIIGMIVGGLLADRLGRRDARWRLLTAGAACLLAGPAEVMFLFSDSWALVLFGMMLTSFLTTSAAGPVYAACLSVAKPRMRATAMAICLLLAGMAGQIFGPLAVGVLNDTLQPVLGDVSVRYSLLVSAAGLTLGGACFAYAARFLAADAARAEAPD